MPCVIRRIVGDGLENHVELAGEEWRLREQVEALEGWMEDHAGELDSTQRWIADIGFCARPDATGGGPPITRRLMELCLRANLEIHLSEYGGPP